MSITSDNSQLPLPLSDLQIKLNNIQPTYTLQNASILNDICKIVKKKFDGINLNEHSSDPNLLLFIANMIEQAYPDAKQMKINKKTILTLCLTKLEVVFDPYTVSLILEFLHSSNQIQEIKEIVKEAKPLLKKFLNIFSKRSSK